SALLDAINDVRKYLEYPFAHARGGTHRIDPASPYRRCDAASDDCECECVLGRKMVMQGARGDTADLHHIAHAGGVIAVSLKKCGGDIEHPRTHALEIVAAAAPPLRFSPLHPLDRPCPSS